MWLTAFKIFSRAWPFLFFSKFAKKEMRSMQWNSGIAREQRDSHLPFFAVFPLIINYSDQL